MSIFLTLRAAIRRKFNATSDKVGPATRMVEADDAVA